jgi:hypothetical protein
MSDNNNSIHEWIKSLGIIGTIVGSMYMYMKFVDNQNALQIKVTELDLAIKNIDLLSRATPIAKIDADISIKITEDGGDDFKKCLVKVPISIQNLGNTSFSVDSISIKLFRGIRKSFPNNVDGIETDNTPGSSGDIEWGKPVFEKSITDFGSVSEKSESNSNLNIYYRFKSDDLIGYQISSQLSAYQIKTTKYLSGIKRLHQ